MILSVSYELRQPRRDYAPLLKALRQYTHCHMMDSYWLLDTAEEPAAVRDKLCALVDENDSVFVIRLQKHWASCRRETCTDWLKDPSRNW